MGEGSLPAIIWVMVALGLLWLIVAAAVSVLAARRFRLAEDVLGAARSNATLLGLSPARPLVVRADGRMEADARLLRELGVEGSPRNIGEMTGEGSGIAPDDLDALKNDIEAAR